LYSNGNNNSIQGVKKMENKEIKDAIKTAGIKQWEVADRYGLGETTFCRMLRKEVSTEKKERIMAIIKEFQSEEVTE
jgi:hypothetical protein